LPDLPVTVNHAMATASHGRLYVVGGYGENGPRSTAFVLAGGRWRTLPHLPVGRAAGGAAVVGSFLYIAGGHTADGLARTTLAYPLRGGRWRSLPGPTPREHLGVTALGGILYAVGGRKAGYDTNLDVVESWRPGSSRWSRLPALPEPRGGTGVAAVAGSLVSVGGEAPEGTAAAVYAYRPGAPAWTRLADLPSPRHGLAVVGLGATVHVIGGGPQPGLTVSDANESLTL
jgi:non-specific serine/threonine protein kinase